MLYALLVGTDPPRRASSHEEGSQCADVSIVRAVRFRALYKPRQLIRSHGRKKLFEKHALLQQQQ